MKYNSLINYGGGWINDIITLTSNININDTEIECSINDNHYQYRYETGDIITIKILDIKFSCIITSKTKLEIIKRDKIQVEEIDASEICYLLLHLVANNAEDLVTKFELERVKKDFGDDSIDWVDLYYIIDTEISSLSYDLSNILTKDISKYHIEVKCYDIDNDSISSGKLSYESTELDWDINMDSKIFTWVSSTPISGSTLMIIFSYRLKSLDAQRVRRKINPENMIENVYDNSLIRVWMGPISEIPNFDEQEPGIIYIGYDN